MENKTLSSSAIYKYKINELLIKQYGIYSANARARLYQSLGITRQTFSADANILLSSDKEITPARLMAYSSFFNLESTSDLLNEPLKTEE